MKAGRLILIAFIACALVTAAALTYRRWPSLRRVVTPAPSSLTTQESVSSVPPFSTREPNRYQATRIITSNDNASPSAPPSVTRILIARDGEQRREDYDSDTDFRTSYLETAAGTFILMPGKRIYANLNSAAEELNLPFQQPGQQSDADFSPDRLLNDSPGQTKYEKLGVEKLNEQVTTKYRVTNLATNNGTENPSITLIWIDEPLGMPVKTETESVAGNLPARLTTELRDIKLKVDPTLFEIPRDYQQVGYSEFLEQWRQVRSSASKQPAKP